MLPLAYAGRPGADLAGAIAAFGTDWFYVVVPSAALAALLGVLARRAALPGPAGFLRRATHGAADATGLPAWCAGPLVIGLGALVIAVEGFLWDVAWHIDVGRDEFLFSPPHVCLLISLLLLGLAGAVGIGTATRDGARVGWRVDRWRVPYGAAALLAAGAAASLAFAADELWHWAYGLDVTMWSPPHLTMISAAALSTVALWLLVAEAGPGTAGAGVGRLLRGSLPAIALIGLSAWQLEFDLGVPQWPHLYHPLLVGLAGGFALTAARTALGRGGALVAVAGFLAVRGGLALLTAGAWGLSTPRFVPYLSAALAVEAAYARAGDRGPLATGALCGAAVGTAGLAGAWLATHLWGYHPWQPALLPEMVVATIGAVAAGVLGSAFGRAVSYRPTGMRAAATSAALLVVAAALLGPLPRSVPDVRAAVRTSPAAGGHTHVEVRVEPPEAAHGADWFEVLSWQGDGRANVPLIEIEPGRWATSEPVPASGDWKTMVRLARDGELGAMPVYLPADPEIGAPQVPLAAERSGALVADAEILLREATEGPLWPGVVGYALVVGSVGGILSLLVAGTVGLERRRRALGWTGGRGSLAGVRVVLTGAGGGIGRATAAALRAQGAHVVGLDLQHGDPGERSGPARGETLVADVTDLTAVKAAVGRAAERLGGIDVVVANAGIGHAADTLAFPDATTRRVMDVNLYGAWNVVTAAAPHLLAAGGRVVVIGSGLAVATVPYAAAYTASKRALAGYADVLRMEMAGRLVVSVVHPAYIRTAIHDAPEASGASLEGAVRRESVTDAAAAVVAAVETGRRDIGSSPVTTAQLWLARHLPSATDRVVGARWRRVERTRPRPRFVTDHHAPEEAATT